MKKYSIFLTVLVLTLSLLTGCGCTPQKDNTPSMPTRETMPTVPATIAPTMPVTEPTQRATTAPTTATENATTPAGTEGNTPTGDITDSTGPNAGNSTRGRRMR